MVAQDAGRVLVVDDDVASARGLARLLRADGFDVELRFSGPAALSRLRHAPTIRVLITELVLPIVDGLTLAAFARAHHPGVRVVVTSAYPQLAPNESVRAVFAKPIDYTALRAQLLESDDECRDGAPHGRPRPDEQAGPYRRAG